MSTARESAPATVLPSGKVLVAGGENNSGPLASAELYDPATNTWSAAADMSTARTGATATLLRSGEVLVAGGTSLLPTTPATAELYDPSSNSWSLAGTIAPMFSAGTATLLPNGRVLVVGVQATAAPFAPIAELYHPLTNTWSPAATPGTGREGGTATLLRTGEVLFAGGFSGTDPAFPAGTELYDPNADAWSDAGTMSVGRDQAAATLVRDGRVLVVGGANSGQSGGAGLTSVVSSAELFTPPAYVPMLPVNTALPSISGDLTEGQTLTVSRGSWTNAATSYSYRWQRCDADGNECVSVLGATADTYTLVAGDVGSTMRVEEWATNAIGTAGPASSLATAVVSSGREGSIKPLVSSSPRIVGTTRVGQRLQASSGAWTGTAAPSFAYRWQRCNTACVNIAGATSSAYTLTSADARFKVRVLVTATNSAGSTQVASAQVGPIAPSPSQLKALLLSVVAPHGPAARISVLLKRGGHTVVFRTFGAGHAAFAWYSLPRGARLTKRNSGRHPVLIARGAANFTRTTVVKLKVTLTNSGKRMLEKSHGFTLTCHGTYTPVGYPTATVTKSLKLTR